MTNAMHFLRLIVLLAFFQCPIPIIAVCLEFVDSETVATDRYELQCECWINVHVASLPLYMNSKKVVIYHIRCGLMIPHSNMLTSCFQRFLVPRNRWRWPFCPSPKMHFSAHLGIYWIWSICFYAKISIDQSADELLDGSCNNPSNTLLPEQ